MKFCDENDYANKDEVMNAYPSAVKIERVEGGWLMIETWDEYETRKKQA